MTRANGTVTAQRTSAEDICRARTSSGGWETYYVDDGQQDRSGAQDDDPRRRGVVLSEFLADERLHRFGEHGVPARRPWFSFHPAGGAR